MMTARKFALRLFALAVIGLTTAETKPPRPLFADDAPLHIIIQGPIAGLANSKTPLGATLTVAGDMPETLPITIAPRGITRRQHDICPFVPIRVAFPDRPGPGSLFTKQKKLKLVTHCRPNAGFQNYELLELAAYRIYSLMTPLGFRTRLATIDYIDRNGRPITTRPGFFIEDIDDVARRADLPIFKTKDRVPSVQISARDAARYALFEEMIGNLDWAMNAGPAGTDCCHNSRLLGTPGTGLVPVPYDYDFAGLVDTPYATPPEGIDVETVRQRRYRGYCRTNEEAKAVAAEMLGQRAAILGVLDGIPGLEDKPRHKGQAYLAEFFDQIATPEGLGKMTATCLR